MMLSIVIPTYNERENILLLLEQLTQHLLPLAGRYEIIVVDDQSPDGTADIAMQAGYPAVRLLQRSGQRDLSAALAEGFDSADGEYLLAMDADLQHDPAAVLSLLQCAQQSQADLVIATRYARGGSVQGWGWLRQQLSRLATQAVQSHLVQPVSDPLSGFFLLQRAVWQRLRPRVLPAGFKLLLELLTTEPDLQCAEVGYCFVPRERGSSKLGTRAGFAFACVLCRVARSAR